MSAFNPYLSALPGWTRRSGRGEGDINTHLYLGNQEKQRDAVNCVQQPVRIPVEVASVILFLLRSRSAEVTKVKFSEMPFFGNVPISQKPL